ncbi:hypothetical protein [uncultured Rikenella sp.]|uniref:hypothetical protein n=1 Tax=uncultured Rikenella sp. TaxID=368003 RepID=UPI0025DB021D|nr:hypothetical protein [uncultured Rikenella sp.]
MKKHFFVFLTALAAVMVSSCNKDNDVLNNPNDPNNPNNPNNFKGPWNIELQVNCSSIDIELAGTGTATIDWGDGIIERLPNAGVKKAAIRRRR